MKDRRVDLTVRSKEGIVYQGEIASMSSKNAKGKFDVLFLHANFITLIDDVLIIRETSGNKREIEARKGVIRVSKNQVNVYLGITLLEPEEARNQKVTQAGA